MKKTRQSLQALPGSKQISFLPEPDFNLTFPSKNTLEAKLLTRLLNGETFPHPEWEQITGSWRCAATVELLIKKGWPIKSYHVSAPTPNASHRHISRYYLPKKLLKCLRRSPHE